MKVLQLPESPKRCLGYNNKAIPLTSKEEKLPIHTVQWAEAYLSIQNLFD